MTSKKCSVLMFAAAIFTTGAAMPGLANPASAGNSAGRTESNKVLRTIPVQPLPGFVNTIHPILSPGQKPVPGSRHSSHARA